jgi:hypothetical protein
VFVASAILMLTSPGNTVLVTIVAAVGVGAVIDRWWSIGLAVLLIPLAIPFNEPDPDGTELLGWVIYFYVPIAAGLLALGWLGGKAMRRWG